LLIAGDDPCNDIQVRGMRVVDQLIIAHSIGDTLQNSRGTGRVRERGMRIGSRPVPRRQIRLDARRHSVFDAVQVWSCATRRVHERCLGFGIDRQTSVSDGQRGHKAATRSEAMSWQLRVLYSSPNGFESDKKIAPDDSGARISRQGARISSSGRARAPEPES